jgi:uncharacterized membrane protein
MMFGIPGLDVFGAFHAVVGVVSLALGGWVLLLKKGTPLHKRLGLAYLITMLLLNGTALAIYDLSGGFGPFHVAAIVSLATITASYVPVLLHRPRSAWLELHAHFMCWSYVGLIAAFVAEVTVRLPGVGWGAGLVAGIVFVLCVGGYFILTLVPRLVDSLAADRS